MSVIKTTECAGSCLSAFLLSFIAITLICVPESRSAPNNSPTLLDSVNAADVIAVGTIKGTPYEEFESKKNSSIVKLRAANSTIPLAYTISVERVLKGDQSLRSKTIKVHSRDEARVDDVQGVKQLSMVGQSCPQDYQDAQTRAYGLLLLKKGGSSTFECVNTMQPILEIANYNQSVGAASSDLLSGIVDQLLQFLANSADKNISPLSGQGWTVSYSYAYRQAAETLRHAPYLMVKDRLKAIARSDKVTPLQSLLAIDVLFGHGDYNTADRVQALLLKPLDIGDEHFNMINNWSPIVDDSAYVQRLPAIFDWLRSKPEVIASIGKGLSHFNERVRRQAACVLSELGTSEVMAPLSNIGLNDRDRSVQFFSCVGLSRATGMRQVCNGNFQFSEDSYVNFYKNWSDDQEKFRTNLTVPKLEDVRPNFQYTHELELMSMGPNLQYSLSKSTLIVAGRLVPVSKAGFDAARYRRIVVEKVLKNSGHYDLENIVVSIEAGASTDSGIYFLDRQEDGTYRSPDGLYLTSLQQAAGPQAHPQAANTSSDGGEIAAEMIEILLSPQDKLVPGNRIETSYRTAASACAIVGPGGATQTVNLTPRRRIRHLDCTAKDAMYGQAAAALKQLAYQDVVPPLRALLKSAQLEEVNKVWLVKVLFSFGDFEALDTVKPLLLSQPPLAEQTDCAVRALTEEIKNFSIQDKPLLNKSSLTEKVSILTDLMHSKRVEVRRAAAENLGRVCPSDAARTIIIDPLANIGLYDPDMDVRYNSVVALEGMANSVIEVNCSYSDFEKDQAKYVGRMRRWAFYRPMAFPSDISSRTTGKSIFDLMRLSANQCMLIGLGLFLGGLIIPGLLNWVFAAIQHALEWANRN